MNKKRFHFTLKASVQYDVFSNIENVPVLRFERIERGER